MNGDVLYCLMRPQMAKKAVNILSQKDDKGYVVVKLSLR